MRSCFKVRKILTWQFKGQRQLCEGWLISGRLQTGLYINDFRFLWPCIVSKVWRERKPTRCNNRMLIINFCLNMFRASLCPSSGDQDVCYCVWCTALVLLDVVGSGCGALRCGVRVLLLAPYKAAPHNRYQPHPAEPAQYTICSNTRSLFSWGWA